MSVIIWFLLGTGAALAAEGDGNRLAGSSSPYLALHVDDPVHWRPWGPEALAEAKRDGKLIFLSIGYLSCHWCHVMQRDNFKDPETAALMNGRFVNILLDREEFPDVDGTFMKAAQSLGLPTGWPLNLVLTPDAKPIYGGTYFPPERRQGMPAFTEMLLFVARKYAEDPSGIADRAAANYALLAEPGDGATATMAPRDLIRAARALLGEIDVFNGGFGEASKFPYIPTLSAIWRAYLRTGDAAFRDAVVMTLESMVRGGLYDHVGGGFSRYTVDPAWAEPHFEKMLYVNAQMIALMTQIWRETRAPLLEARIRETVGFLFDEMRLANGAFAAALDSDSLDADGTLREGAYYVWTAAQIDAVLGPNAGPFKQAYSVTDEGNWQDTNILHQNRAMPFAAQDFTASRAKLAAARANRSRPRRDEKVLADWSGIAIAALTEAGAAFDEPSWIAAARDTFAFVVKNMSVGGRLAHSWRGGQRGSNETLDDYAQMANAAITLFERTGAPSYLTQAKTWIARAEAMRGDKTGAYYSTTAAADTTGLRLQIGDDSQLPSGNAVMARTLARLYYLTGDDTYRARAAGIVGAFQDAPMRDPLNYGGLLRAADTLNGAVQVVIVARRDEPAARRLLREVWRTSLPGRTLEVIDDGAALPESHPAFGKTRIGGAPTAYVCVGTFCSLPVQSPADIVNSMREIRRTAPAS